MCINFNNLGKTKHIDIKYNYIKDIVSQDEAILQHNEIMFDVNILF